MLYDGVACFIRIAETDMFFIATGASLVLTSRALWDGTVPDDVVRIV